MKGSLQLVSIIIPSYNEGKALLETLQNLVENIRNSSFDEEYEIIVIDSSDDGKADIRYFSHLKDNNRIKIIHRKLRTFPGEARNIGVKNAKYDIIVFTDVGFKFEKDWLVKLIKPLLTDCSIDIAWGITKTSTENKMDRLFAHLIGGREKTRRIIPNVAIRKKVFLDGHWFKNDLRAVEDTRFIHEIKGNYNEVFVEAINYYSGHPQNLVEAFKKWSAYSYYSYMAGYRRKAYLSIFQLVFYLLLIILLRNRLALFLIVLLQFLRVVLKSDKNYKVNVLEKIYVLILSFAIDIGRLQGSLKAIIKYRFKWS